MKKLLAMVTILNTNCRITLLMILFITSLCKPFSTPQYPLKLPKPNVNFVYVSQIVRLANSLADSIIYRSCHSHMVFKVSVLQNFTNFTGTYRVLESLITTKGSILSKKVQTLLCLHFWKYYNILVVLVESLTDSFPLRTQSRKKSSISRAGYVNVPAYNWFR